MGFLFFFVILIPRCSSLDVVIGGLVSWNLFDYTKMCRMPTRQISDSLTVYLVVVISTMILEMISLSFFLNFRGFRLVYLI